MAKRRRYAYTFEDSIERMTQSAYRARFSYDIWWAMESPDTKPRYKDAIARRIEFFWHTSEAHKSYFVVGFYRFFDGRRDTLNFKVLLERAAEEGINPSTIAACNAEVEALNGIVKKIGILRHEVFAHRAARISADESFDKAAVTPNELESLMDGVLHCLNLISGAIGKAPGEYLEVAREDTLDLLEALRWPTDAGSEIPAAGKPGPRLTIRP